MRRALPLALLCAFSWAGVGCSGESEPEVTPPTPRDRLADELALTLCEGAAPCCDELGYGDPTESCRSSMRNAVMASIIAAEDQLREIVPEQHDACVAAFQSAIETAPTCDHLPAPLELEVRCPTVFTPIPEGAGKPGDACTGIYDCASPTDPGTRACLSDGESGRCAWFLDRTEGGSCAPDGLAVPVCPEGLACVPGAETPVCGPTPGLGDACVPAQPGFTACTEGHVCEESAPGVLTCQPEILKGESCAGRPTACATGLFCNAFDNCQSLVDPCAAGDCPVLILQNVCR